MKIFTKQNVFDAALERIRLLYDEFPHVVVSFSGGKDSTVCFELTKIVARERGRLPLKVVFMDQEAEWQATVDFMREVMSDPDVDPYWFQGEFQITNNTSGDDHWCYCWKKGDEWIRPKEDISVKENTFGTVRIKEILGKIIDSLYPDEPACYIAGVRAEETPARTLGLTSDPTYKYITWGKKMNKALNHYTFYPIYDWSYTDIWKAIFVNDWPYNKLYDYMYQHQIPIQQMRVSSVHHEGAIATLGFLQEIEPETWNALTKRLHGVNTAGQGTKDFFQVKELPFMFDTWIEYRDYLLENLVESEDYRKIFRRTFAHMDKRYIRGNDMLTEKYIKECISEILTVDVEMVKLNNFKRRPETNGWLKWKELGREPRVLNKFVEYERNNKADSSKV